MEIAYIKRHTSATEKTFLQWCPPDHYLFRPDVVAVVDFTPEVVHPVLMDHLIEVTYPTPEL